MNENQQIIYMQARLVRLASEEWNMPIKAAAVLFAEYKVPAFIRECFGIFHVEGDYAVLEEIEEYLKHKGAKINEGISRKDNTQRNQKQCN